MFKATPFTVAKTWKCPSIGEWIEKTWYVYVMKYYLAIEKNKIMPFAVTWMQLEIIIVSEVSQKEKDTCDDILYMWNLKYGTIEPIYEPEIGSWMYRTDLCLPRVRELGEGYRGRLGLADASYQI